MINTKQFFTKYSIWLLILIFFVAYSALAVGKHLRFETSAADLGIYAQSVWHYSSFRAPISSIKNFNQLGDHFNPTLALFAPFYWIWPNAQVLLIAQSLLVTFGALPIYWLAKEKLGEVAGLILSFAYLAFPGTQAGIDFNFHPEVVAATWIGFSIYFLLKKKFFWYAVFAILALGSKEDIAPIFAGLGIYILLVKRWYRLGFATLIISIFWFYVTTSILMPYFAGSIIKPLAIHSKAAGLLSNLFFNQPEFFKTLTYPFDKVETVLTLFGSFAFIPATSPLAWFTTPATFANRFVSDDWSRWSTHFQYSSTIAPLLAIAVIFGIENLKKLFKKINFAKLKFLLLAAILVGTFWTNRPGWDPPFITPPLQQVAKRSFWKLSENQKLVHQILKKIPHEASVATNTNYVPYLINRNKIYAIPDVREKPEIYFLTTFNLAQDKTLAKFEEEIKKLRQSKDYQLIFEKDGILLFAKKSVKI